jgi:hypothetical protein
VGYNQINQVIAQNICEKFEMYWPVICGTMALLKSSVHGQVFKSHFGCLYVDVLSAMIVILAIHYLLDFVVIL